MTKQPDTKRLVLIVDDEPAIAELIVENLGADYRTVTAANGIEGVAKFRLEQPDVVLLDINMPRMDGLQAQQQMHELDPTVPVVMLTSVQDLKLLATALRNGAFSYLPKPFDAIYLMHIVAAAVSQRRRR